ncbi:molybdate transport system regulatory protein [Lebetimonas natsushimae]|uniref:Molybdate transport system regulatory protein n=1 Tax=Lebetimonas natsushimae TaxID=1936991 RepID=A0A292YG78_9BACT|nr:LysR family transcriptional regulator [Lebetimonas natsushimae]GAX88071.1 molybdate transport system regulatory protein [Lebetimonas natsushimae]
MIKLNFWIDKNNKSFLGKGRIKLLKLIDKYGSISKAAREMKMSYKAAWDAIDIINSLSKEEVVEKQSGGKGGGGTYLTEYGKQLIRDFENLENEVKKFRKKLNEKYKDKF